METNVNTAPQYPDFGALLESIKENGRRMDENYARYLEEKKERDAKWEKEHAEFKEQMKAANERLDKISADTNRAIKDIGKAADYARKQGLFTLKLSGEDIFTMSAPKMPLTF